MQGNGQSPGKCELLWAVNGGLRGAFRDKKALGDELQDLGRLPVEFRSRARRRALVQGFGEDRTLHRFIEQAAHRFIARQQALLDQDAKSHHRRAQRRHRMGAIL